MSSCVNFGVIEKVTWPGLLLWCFLKDLTYYLIHANFHSQVLTSSRLMTLGWGGAFRLPSSRPGYLMSKKFKLIWFKLQSWLNTCFCFTDGSECYNAINFKKYRNFKKYCSNLWIWRQRSVSLADCSKIFKARRWLDCNSRKMVWGLGIKKEQLIMLTH